MKSTALGQLNPLRRGNEGFIYKRVSIYKLSYSTSIYPASIEVFEASRVTLAPNGGIISQIRKYSTPYIALDIVSKYAM